MRTTTTKALKAAALTALEAAIAALPPDSNGRRPKVSYGFPGTAGLGAEFIFLGGITSDDDWSAIGQGSRDEEYTVTLIINVQHQGWTQQRCTERAYDLLAVCDAALTSSHTVQLLPPPARSIVLFGRLTEKAAEAGREAEISAGLKVWARI